MRKRDLPNYIFFMHDDARMWKATGSHISQSYRLVALSKGVVPLVVASVSERKDEPPSLTVHLAGYIRVNADDLDHAKSMLAGNPHFEAGGTVEIRELPRTD